MPVRSISTFPFRDEKGGFVDRQITKTGIAHGHKPTGNGLGGKGRTWTPQGSVIAGETDVRSLAYLGGGVVLAGTYPNGKIARSTDFGATWTPQGSVIAGETYVRSLAYLGSGIILAGTSPNGKIARSTRP